MCVHAYGGQISTLSLVPWELFCHVFLKAWSLSVLELRLD